MVFGFDAGIVDVDPLCIRLAFASDDSAKHYFIMDRSEEYREVAIPDMENVYIERDDQLWGGYGGIELVVLERNSLTLYLGPQMATKIGNYEQIRVSFSIAETKFQDLRSVLSTIMRGYEGKLQCDA